MSDSTIRASIKSYMEEITGIGKVNDYERWTNDSAALVAMFKTDPKDKNAPLFGWEITRDAIPRNERITNKKYKPTYSYVIKGYYALKDDKASEKLFQPVIDLIIKKFVNKIIPNTEAPHPVPTATKIVPYLFAGVMVHYAEIRMLVNEIVIADSLEAEDVSIRLGQYLETEAGTSIWKAATAYALNAIVVPQQPNGHKYICTTAGVSGAAEPAFPLGAAATIVDGTAVWTEDGAVTAIDTEITL